MESAIASSHENFDRTRTTTLRFGERVFSVLYRKWECVFRDWCIYVVDSFGNSCGKFASR
ncbi:MAG: hypothetical protein GX160_08095 [Clostridiales bacterium]|nr:hypothetical protein [Clostridiales bacterium]